MAKSYYPFLVFLFLSISMIELNAQNDTGKDDFLAIAIENAKKLHDSKFEKPAMLANGREYIDYDNRIKGHPYFLFDGYEPGSVILEENAFQKINLKYDVYKDLLVLEHYDQHGYGTDVYLINERVKSFYIKDYLFKRLFDEKEDPELAPGFYNFLYEGDVALICKRNKKLFEEVNADGIFREFLIKDRYYVSKNGEILKMNNRRSIRKAFADEKKEMKKYVRRNKSRFKIQFEEALIEAVMYYDELN